MTVTVAIAKFYELEQLYPNLVQTVMEIFKLELAIANASRNQLSITVAGCVKRALKAEYRLAQVKEKRAVLHKAREEEKDREKGAGYN